MITHQYLKRYFFTGLSGILILFNSCQQGELSMGDDFISSGSYTTLIDTVNVQLSTIKADSIVTSSASQGLVGYLHHPFTGGQEARTYFALHSPSDFKWDSQTQVLDSLVLILGSNSYSIGDTTCDVRLKVHALSEAIQPHDDGKLYNSSSFLFKDPALAQVQFRPYPSKKGKLRIRLSDDYAQEMIDLLVRYNQHEDQATLFKNQFNGFVILSDTSLTRSVLSYAISDTSSYLRLYSHVNGLEKVEKTDDLRLSTKNKLFNQFCLSDEANTYHQDLTNGKALLKEQKSNGRTLLQSGYGYRIRVDFPSLDKLLELKAKGYIVKAELRLIPDMQHMQSRSLPPFLYIREINRANTLGGYLMNANKKPLLSHLHVDHMYHEETAYTFDLTNYMHSRLAAPIVDTDYGLVITLPETKQSSSLEWLAVYGQSVKHKQSQLRLYYYYYDTE